MQEILLLREAAVLIASGAGAYTDYKTGYINDWITLPLIALGIALNIYEQQYVGLAIGAVTFAIGYIMYYTGKIGGGDVKLYTGIALALPFYMGKVFLLSAALFAALSAVVFFSSFYVIKYARMGLDIKYNSKGITRAAILMALLLVYFGFLLNSKIVDATYIIAIGLPMLFGLAFIALEKGIRKEFFLKKIKLGEMEEDEIIAVDFMGEDERKKLPQTMKGVFGEKEKAELEKAGVRNVMVYRNLPRLGPFIFLGVAAALARPELSLLIFGS